jgi:hypothetical protein
MIVKTLLATLLLLVCLASSAVAQTQIPPPAQPIAFCGTQASPAPTSHQLVFDGGAAEAVTIVTPSGSGAVVTFCNANAPGWTHGFSIPANRFAPRAQTYTVSLTALNDFGQTAGVAWDVLVGIAPGQFTITGAGQLPGGGESFRGIPPRRMPAKPTVEKKKE